METFETNIPQDFYSMLVMVVVALIIIWILMFVVRKLIGVALVAALIIGSVMVWQNPAILHTAQETAVHYYEQWRYGAIAHQEQRHW